MFYRRQWNMVPHHLVKGDRVGWGKELRVLKGDRSVEKGNEPSHPAV